MVSDSLVNHPPLRQLLQPVMQYVMSAAEVAQGWFTRLGSELY